MSTPDLVPLLKQHRTFAVLSSIGLTLLYAEEGLASYAFWPQRSASEAYALITLIVLLMLVGYLISFFIPPMLVNESPNYPRAWGVLSGVTTRSIGITIVVNAMAFALLLYLVNFDLTASYNLLRDVYVYTLIGLIFFHGLLLYVRYMHCLYQTPGFVQPAKVITVSASLAVLILLVSGFLFLLDLHRLEAVPLNEQGRLGLHVYLRTFYVLTLVLAAYAWHLRWIADH